MVECCCFYYSSKKLRDELISMGNSNLLLPFTYEGDTTMKGYCKVVGVSVGYKVSNRLF